MDMTFLTLIPRTKRPLARTNCWLPIQNSTRSSKYWPLPSLSQTLLNCLLFKTSFVASSQSGPRCLSWGWASWCIWTRGSTVGSILTRWSGKTLQPYILITLQLYNTITLYLFIFTMWSRITLQLYNFKTLQGDQASSGLLSPAWDGASGADSPPTPHLLQERHHTWRSLRTRW